MLGMWGNHNTFFLAKEPSQTYIYFAVYKHMDDIFQVCFSCEMYFMSTSHEKFHIKFLFVVSNETFLISI